MRSPLLLIVICSAAIAFSGCAREWKNPNTAIPSDKVRIAAILISPIFYDSAGVTVEGKVWDLQVNALDNKNPYTRFKIADREGNFVNVSASGIVPLFEGEIVEVTGIYRRELQTEGGIRMNEIEARQIESGTATFSLR
ncbi:MAG: hypothetical protein ACT4NX_03450 [Deltaproteobacteria bacterium]